MAVEIKLFRSVQKFNQMAGIHPTQPNQKYSFAFISVAILLSLILSFISKTAYFFLRAQTIAEHAQIFYLCATEIVMMINFVTMCLKMRNVLQLIEKDEEFIQKSQFSKLVKRLSNSSL